MYFAKVADHSPSRQWPQQRCLYEPNSAALAELITVATGTSLKKAQVVVQTCRERMRDLNGTDLTQLGLSEAQAAKLIAAIELGKRVYTPKPAGQALKDSESAAIALIDDLGFTDVEKAVVLVLNHGHQLIAKRVIGIGTRSECLVHPPIVFETIMRYRGSRFILGHSHPTGNTTPSPEDLSLTQELIAASNFMHLPMLDHLIIGGDDYASIRCLHSELWQDAYYSHD
jgi:DNA repair protein RadC